MIPVFGNSFNKEDSLEVHKVLRSHFVGTGDWVTEFEKSFAEKIGFNYAVATNSCTNAFWLLLKALGLDGDREIILPNIHFFGIQNVINLHRINYRLTDVDTDIPNICIADLEAKIRPVTKAIIFLEYGGYPLNIKKVKAHLKKIGRQDILCILDAANSPFTMKDSRFTATSYDVVLYSFDMNKILVTGDGGMVLSDNKHLVEKIRSLSLYGIHDLNKSGFSKAKSQKDTWWEFDISRPSLKLCMNNIAAAIGISQLKKIDQVLEQRQAVKEFYLEKLGGIDNLVLPPQDCAVKNNTYFFWLKLNSKPIRDRLARYLLANQIYSTVKYQPLSMKAATPHAFDFYEKSLCIPMNQNLTKANLNHIVKSIRKFIHV
jgi:dTDP-4-amino-4,6-dideoxygalactose transaminase